MQNKIYGLINFVSSTNYCNEHIIFVCIDFISQLFFRNKKLRKKKNYMTKVIKKIIIMMNFFFIIIFHVVDGCVSMKNEEE